MKVTFGDTDTAATCFAPLMGDSEGWTVEVNGTPGRVVSVDATGISLSLIPSENEVEIPWIDVASLVVY